jgi:GTPase
MVLQVARKTANTTYDEGRIKIQVSFMYYLVQTMQQRIFRTGKRNINV